MKRFLSTLLFLIFFLQFLQSEGCMYSLDRLTEFELFRTSFRIETLRTFNEQKPGSPRSVQTISKVHFHQKNYSLFKKRELNDLLACILYDKETTDKYHRSPAMNSREKPVDLYIYRTFERI